MTACARPPLLGGGCAYRGARMALEPIVDAAHLAHGPATCPGFSWAMRPTASSGRHLHRTSFTTDLGQLDVIRGGEDRLAMALDHLATRYDPAGIFVYQTCVPAMTGDDVAGICADRTRRHGRPVIPVDLPGFAGDRDFGSRAAGDVLLNHLIGTREPDIRTPTDVILIGEANVAGEMTCIRPLLAAMGVRLLASIPGDGRIVEIAGAHRARLSLSLCSQSLGGLADKLTHAYAVPSLQASFYGMANTSRSLRHLARALAGQDGPADLPRRTEALIAQCEAATRARLRPMLPDLTGKRVVLVTGGIKTWSLTTALQELGVEVTAVTIQKTSPAERRCAAAMAGSDHVWDGINEDKLAGCGADLVLSGDGFRAAALRNGLAWAEINHDRTQALAGYDGLVNLARLMRNALAHPLQLGSPFIAMSADRTEGAA